MNPDENIVYPKNQYRLEQKSFDEDIFYEFEFRDLKQAPKLIHTNSDGERENNDPMMARLRDLNYEKEWYLELIQKKKKKDP